MEAAFGWIGELINWLSSLLPHLGICRATHGGVKFVRGRRVRRIRPGLYWWWPIFDEVVVVPVVRQTLNLDPQRLTTVDDAAVIVSVVVIYEVCDVEKALVGCHDLDDTICDVALKAALVAVSGKTFEEVRESLNGPLAKDLTKACRSAMHPFGCKVLEAFVAEFAEAKVLAYVGGLPLHEGSDGD